MTRNNGDAYLWDALNRLVSVQTALGTVSRFAYDYRDRRILRYVEGDPASEVVYLTDSSEIRKGDLVKFIHGPHGRVDRIEGPMPTLAGQQSQVVVIEPGWNAVGIAVEPVDPNPEVVFAEIAGVISGVYHLQLELPRFGGH